jgi:uncharacterized membrane protein (UPF0182 family)
VSHRRWPLLALAAVALILLVGRGVAALYVDYRWFAAMDAAEMWRARTATALLVRCLSGGVAALFAFANLYTVRHSLVSVVLPRRLANLEIGEEVPGSYLVGAAAVLALLLGAILALPGESWTRFALLRFGAPFGETDPYFETDLGFFVYWLPVEMTLYVWALIAVLVMTVVVIVLYALTPSLEWKQRSLYVSSYARRHLAVLASLLVLLLAWSWRLDQFRALLAGSGVDGTFTYADYHANIPLDIWLSILTAGAAVVVLRFAWIGQIRVATIAVGVVLALAIVLRQLAPPIAQRLASVSSTVLRERPYVRTQAAYARRAYAVDRIGRGDSTIAFGTLRELAAAVPDWDAEALARNVERTRAASVNVQGIEWHPFDRGVLAALVNRPSTEEDEGARAWRVSRFIATAADSRGNAVRAPGSRDDESVESVLVFDGAHGYTVVSDSTGRVAGADLSGSLSRLAHAWSLQNFRLLAGDLPRVGARIVTHLDVRERVRELVPFFSQGSTVAPVIEGDSLFWALDLYASSDSYPLSQRIGLGDDSVTYLQHAAVAIVNGRTGRLILAADSVLDPVARSWVKAFPSLFTSAGTLRDAIRLALPPVIDAARAQGAVIARYGLREENSHAGHVPWVDGSDTTFAGTPPPLFGLPPRPGLAWSQAVLDDNDRLVGVVLASGGRDRGTWWLASEGDAVRWSTSLDLLRHAIDSTVPASRDARVIRGQLRVTPVGSSFAFVQPAYITRSDGVPTLARVAVVHGESVLSGRTLAEAVGVGGSLPSTPLPASEKEFRARVMTLYNEMRAALASGDWAAFGRAYDALGSILAVPPR